MTSSSKLKTMRSRTLKYFYVMSNSASWVRIFKLEAKGGKAHSSDLFLIDNVCCIKNWAFHFSDAVRISGSCPLKFKDI